MPKGSNPNSHHNKPTILGLKASEISLLPEQWAFLEIIGRKNKSRGGREVVRAMQVIAKRNWQKSAEIFKCEPTPEALKSKLIEMFPSLQKGRKTADDLIQEIALGECSLDWKPETGFIRIVNLASIAIVDGDRKLVEAYQELASGEIFPRNIEGVAEKIQYPESPQEGALRGLEEELGIIPASLEFIGETFDKNQRSKYQSIESFARKYQFRATLKPEDIKDEYVEDRDGDKTVFRWVLV
jgi:hypothetical protein